MDSVVELKAVSESGGESYGTAVLIKENTLITNAHIIHTSILGEDILFDEFYIRKHSHNDYMRINLVKFDLDLDIAVFNIDDENELKTISVGNSSKIKAGQRVYAIGNLNNHGISLTAGYVSIPLLIIKDEQFTRGVIQSNLTIAEGNSGGALINSFGKLIGITSFRIKDKDGNPIYGMAYSVPINDILDYIS